MYISRHFKTLTIHKFYGIIYWYWFFFFFFWFNFSRLSNKYHIDMEIMTHNRSSNSFFSLLLITKHNNNFVLGSLLDVIFKKKKNCITFWDLSNGMGIIIKLVFWLSVYTRMTLKRHFNDIISTFYRHHW